MGSRGVGRHVQRGVGGGVHLLQNAGQCAAISQLFASLSPAATLATLSLHLIPAPATAPSPTSSHACPLSLSLSLIGEWRCDFSISHAVRPNAKNSHDTEATTTTATTPTTSNQDSRFKMMPESATCGSNWRFFLHSLASSRSLTLSGFPLSFPVWLCPTHSLFFGVCFPQFASVAVATVTHVKEQRQRQQLATCGGLLANCGLPFRISLRCCRCCTPHCATLLC